MKINITLILLLLACNEQSVAQTNFDDLFEGVGVVNIVPVGDEKISVMATIKAGSQYNSVNESSLLNPDNSVLMLDDTGQKLEVEIEISDTINAAKTLRWLLKTHNFFDTDLERDEYARIDELFVDYNPGSWFVTVGKRRLNWGHAFAFNPVNVVVPPRNLLNPNQESEGHPIVWMQNSGDKYSADLVLTRNFIKGLYSNRNQWGVRFNRVFDSFDVSAYYFDGEEYSSVDPYPRMLAASLSIDGGDGLTLFGEYANFDYNSRNYYMESGSIYHMDKDYNEWVLGASSRFGLENTILVELYHNDAGYSESQRVNYLSAVDASYGALATADISKDFMFTKMSKTYLLLGYEKVYRENYNYIFRALVSEDESLLYGMIGSYAFADNYAVELEWTHSQGGSDSEFGNDLYKDRLKLSLNITI